MSNPVFRSIQFVISNLGKGLIGITHSENFEGVCDATLKEENGEFIPSFVWIDDTFNKNGNGAPSVSNFRVAPSFPFKMKVQNMVGAEVKIKKASLGRCAKTEMIKYLFDESILICYGRD